MKKLLFLLVLFAVIGCKKENVEPIEKYKNKGFVVIEDVELYTEIIPYDYAKIRLKSKDSLFIIHVPIFDGKDLKIGDTLK